MAAVLDARRVDARDRLDRASDVVVRGNNVSFRQSFETIASDETFCAAPADVVAAGRRLLTRDMTPGLARVVHDTVTVKIGCNNVPVFSTARGGRSRTLCLFRCTYPCCPAFMDVRILPHANIVKWVLMCTSHNHTFSTFPSRVPRNVFASETMAAIRDMVLGNQPSATIRIANNILCNKNVFQNVLRTARTDMRSEQARALRDAVSKSDVWTSEIHLSRDNTFYEGAEEFRESSFPRIQLSAIYFYCKFQVIPLLLLCNSFPSIPHPTFLFVYSCIFSAFILNLNLKHVRFNQPSLARGELAITTQLDGRSFSEPLVTQFQT